MKAASRVVTPVVRFMLGLVCRVDASELRKVPGRGPLIIVTNHINFLEVPLLMAHILPRDAIGIVKQETWNNPLLGALADVWEAIAIDREGTDLKAMRDALGVLERGAILIVAPEGTRSGDGRLRKGHGGVVQLALRSGAPILPIAHYGGEKFWHNAKAFKRTEFVFRVGTPYRLRVPALRVPADEQPAAGNSVSPDNPSRLSSVSRSVREEMTESVMNSLSLLLPPQYRGVYAEPETASMRCVEPVTL
jgi:1-acyl-sn-glycerol-3-phosphate acyltransferase